MKKGLFKFLLFSLTILFCNQNSIAQATNAADYYFYAKSSTYAYLSGGTSVSSVQFDDALSGSISLGFTFRYCGVDYTNIYASSNGWITFGSSPYLYAYPGSTGYLSTGSSVGIGPAVMALWDDLSGASTGSYTPTASYSSTGSAPDRVFTIEFKNWLWDYSTSTPAISFQVKLFETTNVIQIIYKQESGTPAWDYTAGATIGIGGGSSTDYLSLSDASTAPTASSSTFTDDIRTKPANGQIYEFSPSPRCSGTPSALKPNGPDTKVCKGVDFTLSENVSGPTIDKTYQWQSRPASVGIFTNITGANSYLYKTNISANTDFRLVTTCTHSGTSATSAIRTVNVLEKPSITTLGSAIFCDNQETFLTSLDDTTYKYQWINTTTSSAVGMDTNIHLPTNSGRYTLKVSTLDCAAGAVSTDTVNITVKSAPKASISPSPSVTICTGEVTSLTGFGAGAYQWLNSAGIISGATGSNYSTGSAGNYVLEVTNTTNGCKDTSDQTTVILTAPPTVSISPADSIKICTGLSTTLNSVTTGSGLAFQWINSAGIISGADAGILTTSVPEDYQLIVTAGSCKDTSNVTKVRLIPLPPANITSIGTTTAICPMGNDLKLEANAGLGYTYQWEYLSSPIPGATNRVYNVSTPGFYVVKVIDMYGCVQYSDSFETKNTPASNPTISPSSLEFCEGNIVNLYANYDRYYMSYQWYVDGMIISNDTFAIHPTSTAGSYYVQIVDSFGCTTKSLETDVTVNALPTKPIILQSGSRLYTSISYATYQWYRDGKILAGATYSSYFVPFDGVYTLEVSNAKGCFNISDEVNIKNLGVANLSAHKNSFSLYPNPSATSVNIEYKTPVDIMVTDIQGRVMYTAKQINMFDISNWAAGFYFVSVRDEANNLLGIEKLVKSAVE